MKLLNRKQSDARGPAGPGDTWAGNIFRSLTNSLRALFWSSSSRSPEVVPPPIHHGASSGPPVELPAPAWHATIRNAPLESTDYSGLSKVNTLFIIDDSISMGGSNWDEASAAFTAIAPICVAHNSDGVDVHFLNHKGSYSHIRSSEQFLGLLDEVTPSGASPTGRKLGEILERYLKLYRQDRSTKPLNIIIITDGDPSDPSKLKKSIVECAKQLDRIQAPDRQVGVQFLQVGGEDAATESLEELDNALAEEFCIRDMVDTVSWREISDGNGPTADAILKVVLGAMDHTLDRRRC